VKPSFTVFTKPWKMPLPELGRHVADLGFGGIELPVRPGYQVEPENVSQGLPKAAKVLEEFGVRIASVAGPTDERTIAACGEVGVPIIRICVSIGPEGYLATEAAMRRRFDALLPALEKHGVAIGIQNHCDRCVGSAVGTRRLVEPYDPACVCAVWDAAHCALAGEPPELAADILWSHLRLVNLKNAFWRRLTGPEAEVVRWGHYWTSGRQGLASWPKVASELKARGYQGDVCLTAEYSDEESVNRLVAEDLMFARSLFEQEIG